MLTFNPWQATVITHTQCRKQGQRSGGSKVKWKWADMSEFITFFANAVVKNEYA